MQADRRIEVRATENGWSGCFAAMGGPCEILIARGSRRDAERIAGAVSAEAWRVEDKYSRYLAGNVVHTINSADGRPVEVDEETANLLDFAAELFGLSDGKFDITSGVLRKAWHFDGSDRIPRPETIEAILDRVGWHRARWTRPRLRLEPGMEIDLGGIAKEYAVDRCAGIAAEAGPCLVNFGGDLAVTAPPARRRAWKIGVEGRGSEVAQHVIELRQGALATSGDARRFLLRDGVRYGHILDPTTGWPVPDAPSSVTVAADTCTQAGMLSTLAILQGREAERYLDDQGILSWCRRE